MSLLVPAILFLLMTIQDLLRFLSPHQINGIRRHLKHFPTSRKALALIERVSAEVVDLAELQTLLSATPGAEPAG